MDSHLISEMDQYLTFILDEEVFALEITKVKEVMDYTTITPVPCKASHLRGVINLRGNVVTVMDLRLRLGMSETIQNQETCIVIVESEVEADILHMGILTDAVQEVIHIPRRHIEQAPEVGIQIDPYFIRGIGKLEQELIIILDIDRVLFDYRREDGSEEENRESVSDDTYPARVRSGS